jgi:phosphate:Na+ symporter
MVTMTSPTTTLGLLITGVVLLLYGIRQITEMFRRMADARVYRVITSLTRHPVAIFGVSIALTAILQSSSAMSSLLVGLVSANLLPLASAIVMLLGANIGSTLVVQLLAWHVTDFAIELMGLLTAVALFTYRTRWHRIGRMCLAFGLVMVGLAALSWGCQPLATSPVTALVLKSLAGAPVVLMLIGAVLAMVLSSSAASIGLILALASNGTLPAEAALILMLGANVGTTLTALLTASQEGTLAGRRLALVHASTKLVGALVMLLLIAPLETFMATVWSNAGTQVALAHVSFNLALALVFVPLARPLASLMERLVPERTPVQGGSLGPRSLDPKALAMPAVALGLAMRETLHMADVATEMLHLSMQAFEDKSSEIGERIETLDDQLDELHAALKGYLTQLDEATLTEEQARLDITLLYLITDLQAIGDVIAKRFMSLAQRLHRNQILFSEEGWDDLLGYHQQAQEALQQVLAALVSHNPQLVASFLERKEQLNQIKRELHLRHIRRLRAGVPSSMTSSALHLDLLDAISTIVAHTSNMAMALAGDG